ncbi:MAG: DUF2190 family protein [Melioribacteraceae bacterium]|nr:DUF2190 family protein [Melioribacteraceae bacterium]
MKTEQITLLSSIEIASDLTKNLFIGFDGALCGADAKAFGVLNADTLSGEQAPIAVSGIALVYSGGAVAIGDEVVSDANGKAVSGTNFAVTSTAGAVAVTADAATPTLTVAGGVLPQKINGTALDTATAADELIRVLLK